MTNVQLHTDLEGKVELLQRGVDFLVECKEMMMNASTSVAKVPLVQAMPQGRRSSW